MEIVGFYRRHLVVIFWHSLPFTNSLPRELIRVAIWWWNQAFYFLFQSEAGFSTFYVRLLLTGTLVWVNILSTIHLNLGCLFGVVLYPSNNVGCCSLLYILARSKVISGWVSTYDSVHSWWLYNVAQWETRLSAPDIPLSQITLTLSQPVLALS